MLDSGSISGGAGSLMQSSPSVIRQAGVIPIELQQKYYNKWVSGSPDLFGTDHSGSAQWAYAWGIKGRVDEDKVVDEAADREHLNEHARMQFWEECAKTIERVNAINPSETKLVMPDIRFNRKIGEYAGKRFTTDGRELTESDWENYISSALPTQADDAQLQELFKDPAWIAPKGKSEASAQ